jgi:hypothetical protein
MLATTGWGIQAGSAYTSANSGSRVVASIGRSRRNEDRSAIAVAWPVSSSAVNDTGM